MTLVDLRHLRKAGGVLYFWLELDSFCAGAGPRVGDNHCCSQNGSGRPILADENRTAQGNSIRCGAKERGDLCGIRRVRRSGRNRNGGWARIRQKLRETICINKVDRNIHRCGAGVGESPEGVGVRSRLPFRAEQGGIGHAEVERIGGPARVVNHDGRLPRRSIGIDGSWTGKCQPLPLLSKPSVDGDRRVHRRRIADRNSVRTGAARRRPHGQGRTVEPSALFN